MNSMEIAGRKVDNEHPPLIVAEMSGNHNQSLGRALEIVDAAAKAGAQAIKLQTYTADTMTLDLDSDDFFIGDSTSLWQGTSLYKLYAQAYTPWEWHKPIFDHCRQLGAHRLSALLSTILRLTSWKRWMFPVIRSLHLK